MPIIFLVYISFFSFLFIQSPLCNYLIGDETTHYLWANAILHGQGNDYIPFFRTPAYGYFLSSLYSLHEGLVSSIKTTQFMALSFLSALLIYHLSLQFFNKSTAKLAVILFLFNPLILFYQQQLLIEPLFITLSLITLILLKYYLDKKTISYALLTGFFFALTTLSRPNMLAFLPVILWLFIRCSKNYFHLAGLLSALLLTLLPTTWLNYQYGHHFCLLSTQGGINFYAGNSLESDGIVPLAPALPPASKPAPPLKESIWKNDNIWETSLIIPNSLDREKTYDEITVSDWWYQKTISEIKNNPIPFIRKMIKKSLFLIASYEAPNNTDPIECMKEFYPLLFSMHSVINFFTLWIFFIPGLYWAWKKLPETKCLMGFILSLGLFTVFFFVNSRFRIPLIPVMTLFSAYGITELIHALKVRKEIFKSLKIFALSLLISIPASEAYRLYPESWQIRAMKALYHNEASKACLISNNSEKALEQINKAIELNTNEKFIFFHTLSRIYKKMNQTDRQLEYLKKATELNPHPLILKDLENWRP